MVGKAEKHFCTEYPEHPEVILDFLIREGKYWFNPKFNLVKFDLTNLMESRYVDREVEHWRFSV